LSVSPSRRTGLRNAGSTVLNHGAFNTAHDAASSAQDIRAVLTHGLAALRQQFEAGTPVEDIVHARADLVDHVLGGLWRRFGLADAPCALLAVGGYGRGELHPYSDVDIAIVLEAEPDANLRRRLEALVTFLFDTGLDVGHSVRTIGECVAIAGKDITIATNLMEARLVAGPASIAARLREAIGPHQLWPVADFFRSKVAEQRARHAKTDSALQRLEPNVKESPGGLRDIQVICWVANRHFRSDNLAGLVAHGFLTQQEYAVLSEGRRFLWEIRTVLHFAAERREDRLLFDYQRLVAARFGHHDDGTNAPIEHFMKRYYRTVRELNRLNEMLLGLFEEAILEQDHTAEVVPLNRRFQIRNHHIEATQADVFRRTPTALLEIFLLIQQHPRIEGVRASTIRLIRESVQLIDNAFLRDIRARSLFMEIIRQPRRIGHELQRMHRYGVLERYLPAFGQVAGLMQFDLFHVYTVDEHSLFVVLKMRQLLYPETEADDIPSCREAMEHIPKLELLYIAGLFHDLAKGRGGDHSELGAEQAIGFCRDHGLSHFDTRLVAWLVRNHLVMSITAQRKDISDPAVIHEFAELVGDAVRLDYLYVLTVADIRGTNPALWTSWKAALLRELYRSTAAALKHGSGRRRETHMPETQAAALALLRETEHAEADVRAFWNAMEDEYFYRYQPEEIAWHAASVLAHAASVAPLVRVHNFEKLGGTAVFIYCLDADYLFATIAQVLDRVGLTIHDARIMTTEGGYALDTFIVLEADTGEPVGNPQRAREIALCLERALATGELPAARLRRMPARHLKHLAIPTEVKFNDDVSQARTVMSVIATDRPGFLSSVGRALQRCRVRVHNARIATFGVRVEDFFYITDFNDEPVDDPVIRQCLESNIRTALGEG
jgi:[protein-PII] uridylyltransferase